MIDGFDCMNLSTSDMALRIPASVHTFEGFREWVYSGDYPEHGRITFFQSEIFIDMSPEQYYSHNRVKTEIGYVVHGIVKELDLGDYCQDGMWITDAEAELSNEPDGTFVSWESIESGRVKLVRRDDNDGIELTGALDWTLEVVSRTSVVKDNETLRTAYHAAGVREYWIVDARNELLFEMLVWRPTGFDAVEPDSEGWLTSEVFSRSFRLVREKDRLGDWRYDLQVRERPSRAGTS